MSHLRRTLLSLHSISQSSNTFASLHTRSFTSIQRSNILAPARQPISPPSTVSRDVRTYSSDSPTANIQPPDYLSEAEKVIFNKIKGALQPIRLEVQDISGGCGSMFGLDIVSSKFAGLSTIKQHQMVNKVLAEEIKGWHGMQLKTKAVE